MSEPTLTAAERRKQKILARGTERMAKVLGAYSQDADVDASKLEKECPAPPAQAVASADVDSLSSTQPRQRTGTKSPVEPSAASTPDVSAVPSMSQGAYPQELPAQITQVTLAQAMQAASFQTLPLRFACAVGIAAAATSLEWFMPGMAVQVMVANVVLIFSAAWMLKKDPQRCQTVLQQVHIRQGKLLDWCFGVVSKVTRAPVWIMRAGFTIAWALYVDSGTYVAAAILFYIIKGTRVEVPTFTDTPVE